MNLEEKVEHVRRYGLSEGTSLNPEEEVTLLSAHIQYLEDRNNMLYKSLEEIATGYADKDQVQAFAEYILALYNVRDSKNTKF